MLDEFGSLLKPFLKALWFDEGLSEHFVSTCLCEVLHEALRGCHTNSSLNSVDEHGTCFGGGHRVRKIPELLSFLVLPASGFQGPPPVVGLGKENGAPGSQSCDLRPGRSGWD